MFHYKDDLMEIILITESEMDIRRMQSVSPNGKGIQRKRSQVELGSEERILAQNIEITS